MMGAVKIMVIRHGEKPDTYNGQQYEGVDAPGDTCGGSGGEHLVTVGWERAGGLVTLFAPPWGPKGPTLATPQFLFASNPTDPGGADDTSNGDGPSQRPYETITAVAAALGSGSTPMTINQSFAKKDYKDMVAAAVACAGIVLISWQHEDIPWEDKKGKPGISQYILTETGTVGNPFKIPLSWPSGPAGARYDLVWVFDRPRGSGPITGFTLFAQMLLVGDAPAPPLT
jgi:hypothetical protein